ncbi:MAG: hypothetical protein Q7W38_08105 [Deltaproteobacteria bacterium]|nr:hypothetical protein [Deltaproteobacteria bacterium]
MVRRFSPREWIEERGPRRFGGHYTVVTWGCGSTRQEIEIVDAKSGAVFRAGLTAEAGISFQMNRRLLIVNPPEEIAEAHSPKTPSGWNLVIIFGNGTDSCQSASPKALALGSISSRATDPGAAVRGYSWKELLVHPLATFRSRG